MRGYCLKCTQRDGKDALFGKIFILKELEREKQLLHPLVHSPAGLSGGWGVGLEPGAKKFIWVAQMSSGSVT